MALFFSSGFIPLTFSRCGGTNLHSLTNVSEIGWHLHKINIENAWEITTGSPDITVAVLDCGINFSHPELSHAQWLNSGEIPDNGIDDDGNGYIDDVSGWDFVSDDNNPEPSYTSLTKNNHGTFIAGILAANNDGLGIVGVAPGIKIMDLKIWYYYSTGNDDSEWASRDDIGRAIQYAVDNGADIISCSFSSKKDFFEKLSSVKYYDEMEAAVNQGVVIVASAGNYNSDTKGYPACFDFVIAVGATDINNDRASYSSYGSWVELVAPGGDGVDGVESHKINSTCVDGTYRTGFGTSYSAPIVAGVVALMKSVDNTLTPKIIRTILQRTAVDLGDTGKDKYFGYGLVDAFAAVTMAQNASTINFAPGYTFAIAISCLVVIFAVLLKRSSKTTPNNDFM